MIESNKMVVTKIGLAKLLEATIEKPLKLTHFAVGDGHGSPIEPNEDMISLVNEKYRDFLNDSYSNENNLTIECVLRANASILEGFKIFELGIFDDAGDMIAISQTPEQYRPSNNESVATEWIASIVLNLSNTDEITIQIPDTIFATVDSVQRLLDRVEIIENNSKKLVESSVGIDTLFNTNNNHKDQDIINIGIKTWGLAGSIVSISDYPMAFKNCGAVDKGDGTFEIPKMFDGTIRNLEKGNERSLGSYEADSIKLHSHGLPDINFAFATPFLADKHGGGYGDSFLRDLVNMRRSSKVNSDGRYVDSSAQASGFNFYSFSSHELNLKYTVATGGEETRMKNTGGQWYMLVKINI